MTLSAFALDLVEILLPVIALFLVVLIGYGVALLRKKIEEIDNEIARQSLSAALKYDKRSRLSPPRLK